MIDLKDLSPEELEQTLVSWGEPPYRARQVMKWVYQRGAEEFSVMTDLSRELREKLAGWFRLSSLKAERILHSSDGTRKYLFCLEDGHRIEAVFIPEERRTTACLSVQVGCPLGCVFCLTGQRGFVRNLRASEIVNQFLALVQDNPGGRITNLVFMGMGEPLLNFDQVMRAVEVLTHPCGLGLAARRITVSTIGIPDKIRELAQRSKINLAVSLHATTEQVRRRLIPISRKYTIRQVLAACREYPVPERRRITFEYLLIAGVNDSREDALRLAELLKGIKCKVNLIPFNEYPGSPFRRPKQEVMEQFQRVLLGHYLTALIRKSRGADILAACGQLGSQLSPTQSRRSKGF